jgi:hypothetical protein
MNWYLTKFTRKGRPIERGWMLAETDHELIDYARIVGYSIEIEYLGAADMKAVLPTILAA